MKPNFCLFNITADPCEYHDLSEKNPDVLATMKQRLQFYEDGMAPSRRKPEIDPKCNPKLHGGVWKPWVTLTSDANGLDISSTRIVFLSFLFIFKS